MIFKNVLRRTKSTADGNLNECIHYGNQYEVPPKHRSHSRRPSYSTAGYVPEELQVSTAEMPRRPVFITARLVTIKLQVSVRVHHRGVDAENIHPQGLALVCRKRQKGAMWREERGSNRREE